MKVITRNHPPLYMEALIPISVAAAVTPVALVPCLISARDENDDDGAVVGVVAGLIRNYRQI